ncbi:unnamed protein product, partial [Iphiclides podalirius]
MKLNNIFQFAQTNITCLRRVSSINTRAVSSSDADPTFVPKSWDEIPGPTSLPLVGQLHHFLPGGSLYKFEGVRLHRHLYKTYGPIVKLKGLLGGPDNVLLFDAESSAEVFRSENVLPKRPGFFSLEYYRKVVKKQKSKNDKFTGLITDHGIRWKELRSTVNPVMMQPKSIKDFTAPLDEIVQQVIVRIKSLRNKDNMIERKFNEEVMLWMLESFGLIAFGIRLNCFDPNLPEDSAERKLIESIHSFFTVLDKLDFKPSIWRYYPTRTFKRAMQIFETVEYASEELMNKAVKNLNNNNNSNREKGIIEKLLEIDKNMAVFIASDLLFGGIDTVGNMMIAIFYLLANNPEKQHKLRVELRSKGDRRQYLRACIKETMRLLPVTFGNMRETSKEYNLLGYNIPKNTYVITCHQYMSLMECHYPRPQEYIPERWLVDKNDPLYYGNAHPFAMSTFGYGARACVGRRVAELEMELFLTRIIENFHITWVGGPMNIKPSLVNYAVGPFNFVFKDVE